MSGVKIINHKGQDIILADFSHCSENEMIEILYKMREQVLTHGEGYLQLADMTNSYFTSRFMNELKYMVKTIPHLPRKRAIVGISSLSKKVLLETYNLLIRGSKVKAFDDIEKAKDWLIISYAIIALIFS